MTFPTIEDVTVFTTESTASSHEVPYPATVNSGELLLFLTCANGSGISAIDINETSVVEIKDGNARNHCTNVSYLIAAGSESGNYTVDLTGGSEVICSYCVRISGWHGTTAPEISTGANAETSTPNPDSLTPSGWSAGAEDTLYGVWLSTDGAPMPVTTWPTGYTSNQNDDSSGVGCSMAVAFQNLSAASSDPSAFTLTGTDGCQAFTFAIRTAAAGNPYYYYAQQ